jgi:aspartyl protease family protein
MDGPDDIARLIYLVLLGAMVVFWFASDYRQKLNQSLQMAAIWLLIFLAAIAAYSFRDVIGGEMFPAQARLDESGAIVLQQQSDGHYYLTLKANSQDIRFVIDTGASDIVLSGPDAETAGLDLSALAFNGEATTANGIVRTARARINELTGPGITFKGVAVSVNGGELDTSLLGMSFIDRFRSVNIGNGNMTLVP